MLSHTITVRSALAAITLGVSLAACATFRRSPAQEASLTDPRMTCARSELTTLGYTVDESVRRPGRLIATRMFNIVRNHRVAIMAEVDSTDHSFEMWARALPRDNGLTLADLRLQPPLAMIGDAMQVQNACENKK
jgi:hypothetical protein